VINLIGTVVIAASLAGVAESQTPAAPAAACTFALSASMAYVGALGSSAEITVTPSAPDCAWKASSNVPFVVLTSAAAGSGPGKVAISVGELEGQRRVGLVTIGGQVLTVIQSDWSTAAEWDLAACTVSFSAGSAIVPLSGGFGAVTVAASPASCPWSASTDSAFVTITGGAAGTGTRTVTYQVAPAASPRAMTMTIAGHTFTLTQTNEVCRYDVTPASARFSVFPGPESSQISVLTGANCPWTVVSDTYFVAIEAGWSGTGSGTVQYAVQANLPVNPRQVHSSPRTALLTVAGKPFIVQQEGSNPCTAAATPANVQAANTGGTYAIGVDASTSCAWTAFSHDPWITVLGRASGRAYLYVDPNIGGAPRTGRVTVAGAELTVTQASRPLLSFDKTSLFFAATIRDSSFEARTPKQQVRLIQSGAGDVSWTAESTERWISVEPSSGTGAAVLSIGFKYGIGVPLDGSKQAAIAVTASGAENVVTPLPVTLTVMPISRPTLPPFGVVDTPAGDSSVLSGSVAVTGWALDNVGVKRVEVWRAVQPGETTPPFSSSADGDVRRGKIFIGDAVFTDGARPDVEVLSTSVPLASRAGWGYLLLTTGLWNQGNGTYTLYVFAVDEEENYATIGTKTIVVNNNAATKPFGGIDTPAIGGDPGTTPNFGWALTPRVNGAATCKIGPNGVQVSIDSGPLQPVVYGDARSDIAGAFPGFSNSAAAGGHFVFDWSTLSNGPHTIGWLVTDDCGRADGVGSRFFAVTTGTNATNAAPAFRLGTETSSAAEFRLKAETTEEGHSGDLLLSRGYGELPRIVVPDLAGSPTIEVKQGERIELRTPRGYDIGYQLGPNGERRALPIGSTWDAASGTFYWQPAPGFLGRYRLVFSNGNARINVRVIVVPDDSVR
jgi:hypothetical protein